MPRLKDLADQALYRRRLWTARPLPRNETVFDRAEDRGSVMASLEEPNVERYLADIARHKEIDQPTHPRQWIVHVSHENLLPAKRMNLF